MPRRWLSVAHQDELVQEAARTAPNETGGALMGYRAEGGDLVITNLIGPGPGALHKRHAFVPDQAYHEREIARLYEESGRSAVYLGDWHSHPNGSCSLSPRDRRTLRTIAAAPEARVPEPLMLIVGGGPETWSLLAHHVMRRAVFRVIRPITISTFGRDA